MTAEAKAISVPHAETPSSLRMIATLSIVSMISGFLIVSSYLLTKDRIAANERQALEKAVYDVLPGAVTRATFAVEQNGFRRLEADEPGAEKVYAGYDDSGRLVGVAIETRGPGYQDIIRVIYGYSPEKEALVGMKVLYCVDTPGLGDRIREDTFRSNFNGMDVTLKDDKSGLLHAIETVKGGLKTQKWQVDGVSGATISSRAVGNMVNASGEKMLPFIVAHIDDLKAKQ